MIVCSIMHALFRCRWTHGLDAAAACSAHLCRRRPCAVLQHSEPLLALRSTSALLRVQGADRRAPRQAGGPRRRREFGQRRLRQARLDEFCVVTLPCRMDKCWQLADGDQVQLSGRMNDLPQAAAPP